jgi:hypothetical protein
MPGELDPAFPSLPRGGAYRLVYSADKSICRDIDSSLKSYGRGKTPVIYKDVGWEKVDSAAGGPVTYRATFSDGHWRRMDQDVTSDKLHERKAANRSLLAVKQYYGFRYDDQQQVLALLGLTESDTLDLVAAFPTTAAHFDPSGSGIALGALRPHQYPSGSFGRRGTDVATFDGNGMEIVAANFFDLVTVRGRILLSFRTHAIDGLVTDKTRRQWLIFSSFPDDIRNVPTKPSPPTLSGVCYFVRR